PAASLADDFLCMCTRGRRQARQNVIAWTPPPPYRGFGGVWTPLLSQQTPALRVLGGLPPGGWWRRTGISKEEVAMHWRRSRLIGPALATVAVALAAGAASASASAAVPVIQTYMPSFAAPESPAVLNQVGVIKVGSPEAKNVLVLEPGTSA